MVKIKAMIFLHILLVFTFSSSFAAEKPECYTKTISATTEGIGFITTDGTLRIMASTDEYYYLGIEYDKLGALAIADNVRTIDLSSYAGMTIDKNDVLWSWGSNWFGQLGIPEFPDQSSITNRDENSKYHHTNVFIKYPHKLLDNVAMVSIGAEHCLAVKKDGSLWGWGYNYIGQLGTGKFNPYYVYNGAEAPKATKYGVYLERTPVKIMDGVKYALALFENSYIIKMDGSLWSWGTDVGRQVDDVNRIAKIFPVKIMDNVRSVGEGKLAVKEDNSLWTWRRSEDSNENKDGIINSWKIMDDIKYASTCVSNHNTYFAIKTDGSLWTWGENRNGQIGDGSTTNREKPYKAMENVVSAVGNSYSIAVLKDDSSLWNIGYGPFISDIYRNEWVVPSNVEKEKYYKPHKIADNVILPEPVEIKCISWTGNNDETKETSERSLVSVVTIVYQNLLNMGESQNTAIWFIIENLDKIVQA